jgi:thiosulfate/3-mercaptopyruvate sulfurtransferase
MKFLVTLFFLLLSSCQLKPTRVHESSDTRALIEGAKKELVLDEGTIVVDARKPFDYTMAHIPSSLNLNWSDFSLGKGSEAGKLKTSKELHNESRRLALKGIRPESKVVVVGYGPKGKGEEGRLAWTLYYLGIKNIQVASVDYFRKKLSNIKELPPKNVKYWRPSLQMQIDAERSEVLGTLTTPANAAKTFLIDVRSREEYFQKKGLGESYSLPDLQAIHIEWKEFFTEKGRPNWEMKKRLHAIGIGTKSRIITLSHQGVRSAAVTMALLSMGFNKTANYSGGYLELISKPRSSFR